jgi:hypothetical protein
LDVSDRIPTDAELGLEEITFPCEMEVWDFDVFSRHKATIVASFEHNEHKRFVHINKYGDYVVWKNARPIPKTLPLTLSELLNIASEVKGVQVTLKEEEK